jgi:predicted DCC family thiol-disulfide oxidoreductase YuxK
MNIVFFDGVCNLCSSSVQFIIKHDKKNQFKFSSLQSNFAKKTFEKHKDIDITELQSIILKTKENEFYTQSTAVLKIASKLNFPINLLMFFIIIPKKNKRLDLSIYSQEEVPMVWQKRDLLDSKSRFKIKIYRLKYLLTYIFIFIANLANSQVKLHLDSALKKHYIKTYGFFENRMCIPFFCDPYYDKKYKKDDTVNLCNRYVFVDTSFIVKIKPLFNIPCWIEPRFSEGLCAVNIQNEIVFIDTNGQIAIKTGLNACSFHQNKVIPFKNGLSKVYEGKHLNKKYYQIYYLNKKGEKVNQSFFVKVKTKEEIATIALNSIKQKKNKIETTLLSPIDKTDILIPRKSIPNHYPVEPNEKRKIKQTFISSRSLHLIQFRCGEYQLENMALSDTIYCGKYIFVDSFFNVKIAKGFQIPCSFEPEFSEGLCAVSIDSNIVYIDTLGNVIINTKLKACSAENNKASTFKNGIATLFQGDEKNKGIYTTTAINTKGERVRLLEFDDLALAEEKVNLFKNLNPEECSNCFVGKGKSNGIWFLIEKSGKIRKKLDLK